jgi:predicted SprT family Zn-dependent metalloprotease
MRRYHGYALRKTILLKSADASEDLVTHELCHIWQSQQRFWHHVWTWATTRYEDNPYELEAREAVERTRNL